MSHSCALLTLPLLTYYLYGTVLHRTVQLMSHNRGNHFRVLLYKLILTHVSLKDFTSIKENLAAVHRLMPAK